MLAAKNLNQTTTTNQLPKLNLGKLSEDRDENGCLATAEDESSAAAIYSFPSRTEKRYHSLRGRQPSLNLGENISRETPATVFDTVATPRREIAPEALSNGVTPTRVAPIAPPRRTVPVYDTINETGHTEGVDGNFSDIRGVNGEQEELNLGRSLMLDTPRSAVDETPRTPTGSSKKSRSSLYGGTDGVTTPRRSSKKKRSNRSTLCLIS
jgi:hypothetical protein